MAETPGTTALTVEQQQWFLDHYGIRYLHVQDNAAMPNRKTRRQLKRKAAR